MRRKIEAVMAWLAIINTVLALITHFRPYVTAAIKAYRKRTGKETFGFQPVPNNVRKLR